MDYEVELNYRLVGHLELGEKVLVTLISIHHGLYAATDQRILSLDLDRIGYKLRIHPYRFLQRIECISEENCWFVQFVSGESMLTVRARSREEAKRFVHAASDARTRKCHDGAG